MKEQKGEEGKEKERGVPKRNYSRTKYQKNIPNYRLHAFYTLNHKFKCQQRYNTIYKQDGVHIFI